MKNMDIRKFAGAYKTLVKVYFFLNCKWKQIFYFQLLEILVSGELSDYTDFYNKNKDFVEKSGNHCLPLVFLHLFSVRDFHCGQIHVTPLTIGIICLNS